MYCSRFFAPSCRCRSKTAFFTTRSASFKTDPVALSMPAYFCCSLLVARTRTRTRTPYWRAALHNSTWAGRRSFDAIRTLRSLRESGTRKVGSSSAAANKTGTHEPGLLPVWRKRPGSNNRPNGTGDTGVVLFCARQGQRNPKRRKNEPRTQLLKEPGLAVPSNGSRTPVVEGAFCCIFTECVLVSKRGYAEKIWPALAYTLIKISNYPFAVLLA